MQFVEDNLKRKTILFSLFGFPLNRIEMLLQNDIKRNNFISLRWKRFHITETNGLVLFEKYNLFIRMSWELTCYAIEVNVDVLDICPKSKLHLWYIKGFVVLVRFQILSFGANNRFRAGVILKDLYEVSKPNLQERCICKNTIQIRIWMLKAT